MLTLSRDIKKVIFQIGKNKIIRKYGQDIILSDDIRVINEQPFVIQVGNNTVELTKNNDDNIQCEYVVQVNKKPTKDSLVRGDLQFVSWIKHPLMNSLTPNDIVESWRGKFLYSKEDFANGIPGLRIPQLGAIYAFMSKAQSPVDRNIIVMPTGTGKTETMLSVLIANQCNKLLVTVPSDALRDQLSEKFISLGVLPKFGIVSEDCLCPIVAVVKENMNTQQWQDFIEHSNVVVTTMPLIAQASDDVKKLLADNMSHLFVDEAHHSEAQTWSDFINSFNREKVTLFTATPFRNDGKRIQGEFIYSFSLKDAQEQGYYKPINFIPVREYDNTIADQVIANQAISILREDQKKGYDHILMARCASKKRANEIMKYYAEYAEYNPVVVYSSMSNKSSILTEIKAKKHRIIVCVNMLGEGFDLPEMKIAAIHDSRQSVAVTLQFIGRFTRTAYDSKLGNASFIANIAYPTIHDELQELYARDADWNSLLPIMNDGATKEEIDFNMFIHSFKNIDDTKVPFKSIMPALSTIIYKTGDTWNPKAWESIFTEDNFCYRYGTLNEESDTLVIVLGSIEKVGWSISDGIQNLIWDVVIVHRYCTPKYNHAYINSSLTIDTDKLVKAIFGTEQEVVRVSGNNVFRVFSDVKRFAVVNFGGRKGRIGNISFKSFYGKDVQEGITLTEQNQLSKNNIFGNGYRNGVKTSIGCSLKGKIWSYMTANLLEFKKWTRMIGELVEDETIDPDVVFRNTLKIRSITELPQVYPISIDWDVELLTDYLEHCIYVRKGVIDYNLFVVDLRLIHKEIDSTIEFEIVIDGISRSTYKIEYFMNGETSCYKVSQTSGDILGFSYGNKSFANICDYFNTDNSVPVIYFANGSQLFATNLVQVNDRILPINKDALIGLDWEGVSLEKESQRSFPYRKDSIQYYFSQYIMDLFDILYDDDGSGEIADLVGIKDEESAIHVYLYHLKYAHEGKVNNQITNFYEVCGQAQKGLKWNDKEKNKEFFSHLLARETKTYDGQSTSRILKGTKEMLENFSKQVSWKKSLILHISIVQPSLSRSNPSEDILNLLGAVSSYIKDTSNIDLKVYCSN